MKTITLKIINQMELKERIKDALCRNDEGFFEKHLGKDFDLHDRFEDEDNDTLLHFALSDKGSDIYKYLLSKETIFNLVNDYGESLLHSIVYSGKSKRIDELMDKTSINIDQRTFEGITPLLLSVFLQEEDVFFHLISIGANVNIADNEGVYPIHYACQEGNMNMVKALVKNNADVLVKTNRGNYPLALAINNEHAEIVRYLYPMIYGENGYHKE